MHRGPVSGSYVFLPYTCNGVLPLCHESFEELLQSECKVSAPIHLKSLFIISFSGLGCTGVLLELSWASLERVLDALGVLSATLGALLGRSWAALGPSWALLEAS